MQLNSVVGGYKVIELIGEGSMGTVFRGIDILLEREVALKLLRPQVTHNPQLVKRFRAEAIALARLNHPNIVTLHQLFCDIEHCFMVLEFVRGETLDSLIRRSGPIPWKTALPLICQALDGLEHAHAHNVIHCDIKPANLVLTKPGGIKLMDFRVVPLLDNGDPTQTRDNAGMFKYMSPEQIQRRHTDYRTDIYAIGAVLNELLAAPAPLETDHEIIRADEGGVSKPQRASVPDIPSRLEKAVLRALETSPDDRYQTAAEFRSELEAILNGASVDEEIWTEEADQPDSVPQPSKKSAGIFMIQSVGERFKPAVIPGKEAAVESTVQTLERPDRKVDGDGRQKLRANRLRIRNSRAAVVTLLLLPVFFHAFYLLFNALRASKTEVATPTISAVESSPGITQLQAPEFPAAIAVPSPVEVVPKTTIDAYIQELKMAEEKLEPPKSSGFAEGVTGQPGPNTPQIIARTVDLNDVANDVDPAGKIEEKRKPKSVSQHSSSRHKKLDGGWTIITD